MVKMRPKQYVDALRLESAAMANHYFYYAMEKPVGDVTEETIILRR